MNSNLDIKLSQKLVSELLLGGILDYLESCPGITQLKLHTRSPGSPLLVSVWEQTAGVPLPQDIKNFLYVTDGIALNWSVQFPHLASARSVLNNQQEKIGRSETNPRNECLQLGNIAINALERMIPFHPPKTNASRHHLHDSNHPCPGDAYVLQDIAPHGKICFVYDLVNDQQIPTMSYSSDKYVSLAKASIYLYAEQEDRWYYMAPDFTSYFRLQLQYLGIDGWQLTRTEYGAPQDTIDWLCFYAPDRVPLKTRKFKESQSKTTDIERTRPKISLDKIQKLISLMTQKEKLVSHGNSTGDARVVERPGSSRMSRRR